jgi:prephenate dehydratase
VPISFVLVARPGVKIRDIRRISTHGHAWAQCRLWVEANMPNVEYIPASSTAAGAMGLLDEEGVHYDAAICAPIVATEQPGLQVLAENIGDNPGAVTRFVLVSRPGALPHRTGADKTTVVVPLPEDRPGALMEILDQFATRGVNLSRIESRPTGQYLGHYFFSIDADGHVEDARVADALAGLHRISPATRFLGSYPRADEQSPEVEPHTSDQAFQAAHEWVAGILRGASIAPVHAPQGSPTA